MENQILKNISIEDIEKLQAIKALLGEGQIATNAVSMKQFAEEYSAFVKSNLSMAYWVSVELALKHLLKFFSGATALNVIKIREVEKFIDYLKKNAPQGYRVYYRTLKAAFNKAIDWGYASENPFCKYKLPKKQRNRPDFITEAELGLILQRLESKAFKIGCSKAKRKSLLMIYDIVKTGFYSGMRLGELLNLRWENVSLSKNTITVGDHRFVTKGKKQRTIPMCEKLSKCIKQRAQSKGQSVEYVFGVSAKRTLTKDYVSKTFKEICRAAGIDERIKFHSLRHSFASYLAQQGVSPYHIKELLGHASVTTTEIYSHLNEDVLKQAIEKFN